MRAISAAVALAVVASACGRSQPYGAKTTGSDGTRTPTAARLRIIESGPADVKSVPFLMAIDAMRRDGYDVEVVTVQRFDLVPDLLIRGDGEIGRLSTQAAWTAIAKGAALRSIVEANGAWEVVARHDVASCRDLDGQGTALSSARSVNAAMLHKFVADHCPGTQPELVVISNSSSRLAALMAGQVAAAQLELQEVAQLERDAPGRFHSLVQPSKEFPQLVTFTYTARPDWARQNPAVVKAFIRAFLAAQRSVIDNAERAVEEAAARVSIEAGLARAIATTYRTRAVWHANGGLTPERVRSTLDFLAGEQYVPAGLSADGVADLSYLNGVLAEIGRR
jgi:ABC-type nitrate/sulfonate/bicarbonate transport system substrate-binding protein